MPENTPQSDPSLRPAPASDPVPPRCRRPKVAELDLALLLVAFLGVPRWASRADLYGTLKLMARRGLPLADGMREMTTSAQTMTLSHRSRHYRPQQIFIAESLHKAMSQGATLSEAMQRSSRIFQPYEIAMVRAGERAGALPEALEALQHIARHASRRKQHFATHIMYPLTMTILVTMVASFILIFIMPKFVDIYTQLGISELPRLTLKVVSFFGFFHVGSIEWLLTVALAIALVIIFRDVFYFAPLVGTWLRQNRLGQILTMLGMQLRGGVPMDEALGVLAQMKGSLWSRWVGRRLGQALPQGRGLGEALQSVRLLPRGTAAPVILAEQSGNVPDTLIEVGRQLQDQADGRFMEMISTIEPLLVFIITIVTGIFIISIYLPIFGIALLVK